MNFLRKLPVLPLHGRILQLEQRQLSCSAGKWKIFEPDYLDSAGPQIPTYPPINIQVKPYFVIVNKYLLNLFLNY
jgi:hypothetical protein